MAEFRFTLAELWKSIDLQLARLWEDLDPKPVEPSAFMADGDGLPPSKVRRYMMPTWLLLGTGLELPEPGERKWNAVKATGKFKTKKDEAAFVAWFESVTDRILQDAVWYRIVLEEYYALRAAERDGTVSGPVPHFAEGPREVLLRVRDLPSSARKVDPRGDEGGARRIAVKLLHDVARPKTITTSASTVEHELRTDAPRYSAILEEAWSRARINDPPTASEEVAHLLRTIARGVSFVKRGRPRGVVVDGPEGDAAREAWTRLMSAGEHLDRHLSPTQLGLTRFPEVAVPPLTGRPSEPSDVPGGPRRTLPRLEQPIVPRLAQNLRPGIGDHPARVLESAIRSSAEPYGLSTSATRASLLLAWEVRSGLGWNDDLPAHMYLADEDRLSLGATAIRTAFIRSGAVLLGERADDRAEVIMMWLGDEHSGPVPTYLNRVWGGLWRDELEGSPFTTLDDVWGRLVDRANSVGSALKRHIKRGFFEESFSGGPNDPAREPEDKVRRGAGTDVKHLIASVFAWPDRSDSLKHLYKRVSSYATNEATAGLDELEGKGTRRRVAGVDGVQEATPPVTWNADRVEWQKAAEDYCDANGGGTPPSFAELVNWLVFHSDPS